MNDPVDPSTLDAALADLPPGAQPADAGAGIGLPAELLKDAVPVDDLQGDEEVPVLSEVVDQDEGSRAAFYPYRSGGEEDGGADQAAVMDGGTPGPASVPGRAAETSGGQPGHAAQAVAAATASSAGGHMAPDVSSNSAVEAASSPAPAHEIQPKRSVRKRPKPGERRLQILQALAEMLEQPRGERVTTAALAARLSVSEAALYRHFASKAQMFEGLIEFIESTLFGLINQITRDEENALQQIQQVVNLLLTFSERNPGMTRVLVGDALINEDERLQVRINQLTDRLELSLKQCFRTAVAQGALPEQTDAAARADLVLSYVLGRWMRYAKGGFKRMPTESFSAQLTYFLS